MCVSVCLLFLFAIVVDRIRPPIRGMWKESFQKRQHGAIVGGYYTRCAYFMQKLVTALVC